MPPATHHPHPTSTTAQATPASQKSRATADNTARILGGAALLLGALGIGAALVARRS
jgi:uncharacterized protein HemX